MIWVDAHISPAVAKWIAAEFGHPAQSVRDLGLRNAKDKAVFAAAGQALSKNIGRQPESPNHYRATNC